MPGNPEEFPDRCHSAAGYDVELTGELLYLEVDPIDTIIADMKAQMKAIAAE